MLRGGGGVEKIRNFGRVEKFILRPISFEGEGGTVQE